MSRFPRRRLLVGGVVALLAVAVAGVGARVGMDARRARSHVSLVGHTGCASAAAFTPDGRRLFTADWGGVVRGWHTSSGKLFTNLSGRGRPINALAASPDGGMLVAGDDGGLVLRWESPTERRLPPLNIGLPVHRVLFSPDGREIAVLAHGVSAVLRFDAVTGEQRPSLPTRPMPRALAYDPRGKMLAVADSRGVRLWSRAAGKMARELPRAEVGELAFSPDGATLAACGLYRGLSLYRVADGKPLRHLTVDQVGVAAFLPHGSRLLFSGGADLWVYDTLTGRLRPSLTPPGLIQQVTPGFLMRVFPVFRDFQRLPVQACAIAPDGSRTVFCTQETATILPLPPRP